MIDDILYGLRLQQIESSGEIHLSDAIRKIRIPSDKCSNSSAIGVKKTAKAPWQFFRN
jgi:hypothetical protein